MDKTQNSWCGYSKFSPPITIARRFDNKSHRFYFWQQPENGAMVTKTGVGITTLLSQAMPESKPLTDWKLRTPNWEDVLETSSDYGNVMHEMVQEWLLNKHIPKELMEEARLICKRAGMNSDMPEKDCLAWASFCEQYEVEPLLIEAILISPPINGDNYYCQAIDLLCNITVEETVITQVDEGTFKSGPRKGEPKITEKKEKVKVRKVACLDWKSNTASKESKQFYASHKYQLIAAKRAVEHNYQGIKVDMLINWSPLNWRTKPNFEMKIWDVDERDERIFDAYINIALVNGYFSPSGNIFVPPSEFNESTKSTDYELLSYEEYVEKYLLPQEITVNDEI
jgi:hypothetical protein